MNESPTLKLNHFNMSSTYGDPSLSSFPTLVKFPIAPNQQADKTVGQHLIEAAKTQNLELLTSLCQQWAGNGAVINSVDLSDEAGLTAFLVAVKMGCLASCHCLYRAHCSLTATNKNGQNALHIAIANHRLEVLHWLLSLGEIDINLAANNGVTTANLAASQGNIRALELLVQYHADVNIPNQNGYTPLNNAAESGKLECVQYLIRVGAHLNKASKNNFTPACTAALWGHANCLQALIKAGADFKTPSLTGSTSVYLAAQNGKDDCLSLLLAAKADVNAARHDGNTPLYAAALNGRVKCLELLLAANALIDTPNKKGETPLYAAANAGHHACVASLIAAGADLNKKEQDGWNPLSAATSEGHQSCVDLLVAAGATDTGPPTYEIAASILEREGNADQPDESSVDEMKIQTMYKMVDECKIFTQGKEVIKKVLYLTNKQAVLFDESAIGRCIQALDIGEPKFVIKLLPSLGVASQMKVAHPESIGLADSEFGKSLTVSSEIDKSDQRKVETQVLLFMKTCIIPLAKQTRALILVSGSNDCFLSSSLSSIALAEQARLGKDCPFTVIATVSEKEVHSRAISPDDQESISSQILRGSRAWMKRVTTMNNFYSRKYLRKGHKMDKCDLITAASRYIIFEDFDEPHGDNDIGSSNSGPRRAFESVFLQYLTRKLPSIAIQGFAMVEGAPFLVDMASRNIPVLLLDTTERAITCKRLVNNKPITNLAKESHAFPMMATEKAGQLQMADGVLTLESRSALLDMAMSMAEEKWNTLSKYGVIDQLDTSNLAFFHSALRIGADPLNSNSHSSASSGNAPLHQRIAELRRLERTHKDDQEAMIPSELAMKVIQFLQARGQALITQAAFERVSKWLSKHDPAMEHFMPIAANLLRTLRVECEAIANNGGFLKDFSLDQIAWTYELLTSHNTYSGSIFDLDGIKNILGAVAKIDRLPTSNSLEALLTLQDAWDHVELYHKRADVYKLITKVCYFALILIGIAITVLGIAETMQAISMRMPILALSFLATAFSAYVTFINPAVKWQQLRMAALSIESEIWTYRTRAGPYRSSGEAFDNSADRHLHEVVAEIKASVLEGADLKATSFYSHNTSYNLHGQHSVNNCKNHVTLFDNNEVDDHLNNSAGHDVELGFLGDKSDGNVEMEPTSHFHDNPLRRKTVTTSPPSPAAAPNNFNAFILESLGGDHRYRRSSMLARTPEIPLLGVIQVISRMDSEGNYGPSVDTHYEPVQPDQYIRYRIHKALHFYKERIPQYNRMRNMSQTLLVLGSIASGVLAIAYLQILASAVSITSAAITAWMEFSGTSSKIQRYSFTVHSLQELVVWWQTLQPIDRSVVSNIDRLILTTEELLQREQQAWKSTSQTVRMLQKASSEGPNNSGTSADSGAKSELTQ